MAGSLKKCDAAFFAQPTLALAEGLLGCLLVRVFPEGHVVCRIVEVEAYHQLGDEASHSFRGQTERNAVMFGPPGFLYVYFIYGMYHCMNIVTEGPGIGAAVLIRALEPLEGSHLLAVPPTAQSLPTNGPGKCCRALAIDRSFNGIDLQGDTLFLAQDQALPQAHIGTGPRIGISKSQDLAWRYYVKGNLNVSKPWPKDFKHPQT